MLGWISTHYMELFGIWAGVLAVAQLVVRLTPTQRDDRLLSKLGAWTEMLRNLLVGRMPGAATKDQG